MRQEIARLFERYENAFNAGLDGALDTQEVASLYANVFLSATPAGIAAGTNDDSFIKAMKAGFDHYRAIGTRGMKVMDVRVNPIDELHALAFVDWAAAYEKDGKQITVPFTNAYLVRLQGGAAKVFGWIAGDEEAELRKYGLA
jgi:hypothetical protein